MLLMKRIPRSTLNLLVPNLNMIIERQEKQKKYFDKTRSLGEGLPSGRVPDIIIKKAGPVSYHIKVREWFGGDMQNNYVLAIRKVIQHQLAVTSLRLN